MSPYRVECVSSENDDSLIMSHYKSESYTWFELCVTYYDPNADS